MKQKSKMPQIGEAVFCIIYLMFGYIVGAYMLMHAQGMKERILFGTLTLVLAGGDSFHLVPRILNAFKSTFEKYEFWAGLGLMVSSITMTIYYILLYLACELLGTADQITSTFITMKYVLIVFAVIRMILCLFPQNNWFRKEGNAKWCLIRNLPFIVVGVLAVCGCIMVNQIGIAIAIIISFGCYLPVVFMAKKNPMIGMLMIPKTIAYMWMICIALKLGF